MDGPLSSLRRVALTAATVVAVFCGPGPSGGTVQAEDLPPKKPRVQVWLESGAPETCIDVLFVGDGYRRKHLARTGKFWKDVKRYAKRLFRERPFKTHRDRFNVRAAFVESKDEGCDFSPDSAEVDTAFECHFDSPRGRLLVFGDPGALERVVKQVGDTDIVFVMVNTEKYGGAGTVLHSLKVHERPLPAPTFSAQDTASFLIAIHELGHSFANLADEYVDSHEAKTYKLPEDGGDIPHPNVTLASRVDAATKETLRKTLKWGAFLDLPGARRHSWIHEGGYYRHTGVYRPWERCMMRKNSEPFCPVCCREIARSIITKCGAEWDEDAYQATHPLKSWR